ncbi:MAG: DJ-1/PfpI family protein [Ferruginibacter sp.]
MKIIKTQPLFVCFLLLATFSFTGCRPIRNLKNPPAPWEGSSNFSPKAADHKAVNKNVFIIADYKMTELFDMLAPFYLFNATKKANVYIVAEDKTPVLIKRGLFVRPQLTFKEVDSMKLQADVIVIPALSKRDEHQDTLLITWIKAHFTINTKMLAICDGASTAAATGLYDGKPLTCHASDYTHLKMHFSKPGWVQNIAVTKSGNLFSTAGVSNAVEGSLVVIDELFGRETMQKVLKNIHYPNEAIRTEHQSIAMNGTSMLQIAKKIIFRKNKKIGVLLENGINEFEMASILDTYGRTLPASFATVNLNSSTIETKYGLTLICTGGNVIKGLNEIHVLTPGSFSKADTAFFKNAKQIRYDDLQKEYPIDVCLKRISELYGNKFKNVVKLSLDYN